MLIIIQPIKQSFSDAQLGLGGDTIEAPTWENRMLPGLFWSKLTSAVNHLLNGCVPMGIKPVTSDFAGKHTFNFIYHEKIDILAFSKFLSSEAFDTRSSLYILFKHLFHVKLEYSAFSCSDAIPLPKIVVLGNNNNVRHPLRYHFLSLWIDSFRVMWTLTYT